MIGYTRRALALIDELRAHDLRKDRVEAILALKTALSHTETQIENHPNQGLPAPRPYPQLAAPGELDHRPAQLDRLRPSADARHPRRLPR